MMRLFILLGIVVVIAAILFGGVFAYGTFYPKYVAYKEQKAAEEAERIRQEEAQRLAEEYAMQEDAARIATLETPTMKWNLSETFGEMNGIPSTPYGEMYINTFTDIYDRSLNATFFDGDGDYIDCGRGLNLTGSDTFTFLFNCMDTNKDYSAIMAKYENNFTGAYAFSIRYGYFNAWITYADGDYVELESSYALEQDCWYLVNVVVDGNMLKLYINGELDNETEIESPIVNDELVTIGRQALLFAPETDLQFTGAIAEVSYYDRVLPDEDIMELYNRKMQSW